MPWDIANRVSLSDLWWRDGTREGDSPREAFAADMANILGPTAGTILGWYTAADHMQRGNYSKAIESVVPKFVRDPIRAVREGTEGVTTYTGEPLMDKTTAEVVGQLLCFGSARKSEMFEGRNAVMEANTVLDERRRALLSQVAKARIDGNTAEAQKTMKQINEWNQRNPNARITQAQIVASVRQRVKNRERREDGILLPPSREFLRETGRFANV